MPVHVCPRCQRTNPEAASYCYFDGALLQGAGNGAAIGQLIREFVFPSGRRCKSFDEFAAGCQEEWVAARDLLRKGVFQQFFGSVGRADLVRAAQEAMGNQDGDIGLSSFLGSLPISRTFQPRLDIHPRRLDLGKLLIGDTRRVTFTISNHGQGQLQGTVKVVEGNDWLSFPGGAPSCPISTAKDQKVSLEISTQKLVALQSHAGKLMVVTNGGIVEVAVRVDLAARPFGKPPYQDVKTPRDMAVRMRDQPKAAVPLLESGEVFRWFASNNWKYPVQGQPTKGMASVQQFFEAMGLAKVPPLQVSQAEFRFLCTSPEPVRFQFVLSTAARKWVYAWVESDQPWLKVLTPQVSGPQKTTISFEIDGRTLVHSPTVEGKLTVLANAGQKLPIRVIVESAHPARGESEQIVGATWPGLRQPRVASSAGARTSGSSLLPAILAMSLAFLLLRIALMPLVDFGFRGTDARWAAAKLNFPVQAESPLTHVGGWLQLPWSRILLGSGTMTPHAFGWERDAAVDLADFRHYFVNYFTRDLVLWSWWLGPVLGVVWMRRRGGGWGDLPWVLVAGSVAGVVLAASLACVFFVIEAVPHALWDLFMSGKGGGGLLIVWILLATVSWACVGAAAGGVFALLGPLRKTVVEPVRNLLASLSAMCGMNGLASFWTPRG